MCVMLLRAATVAEELKGCSVLQVMFDNFWKAYRIYDSI